MRVLEGLSQVGGKFPKIPPGGRLNMKRGKKYQDAAKLVDRSKLYDVDEAVALVKKVASAGFD